MKTVVPISRDDERLDAASRWILKLDEGLSAEDETALRIWLAEHPMNPVEFVDVARAWDKLDTLSRLADVFPIEPASAHPRPTRRSRAWSLSARALYAGASVLILLAIGWYVGPQWSFGERPGTQLAQSPATYETAIGEQRLVTLADGTIVTLNTNSRIRVAYSEASRLLHLVRGQIHVEVAPDRARPLRVIAADRIVQAVGTAFSVALTGSRKVELIVTEGQVLIGVQSQADPDPEQFEIERSVRTASRTRAVLAGQELIVGAAEELIVPISPEDIEVKLAWRSGRLIFRNEPLEQAIAEIERYTTVEFVFLDEDLRQQTISGRYKTGDIESLLLALRANFDIGYEYDGRNRILLRSL